MLNNVNAYLVFSSEQKSTKSECCSLVSEKTIEEHPEGFETQHCVFSLLKEYNKYDLSNARTAFLTLGCIDDNKCGRNNKRKNEYDCCKWLWTYMVCVKKWW